MKKTEVDKFLKETLSKEEYELIRDVFGLYDGRALHFKELLRKHRLTHKEFMDMENSILRKIKKGAKDLDQTFDLLIWFKRYLKNQEKK